MNKFKMIRYPAGLSLLALGAQAHAAVPTEVTAALTEAKDDALVIGAAVVIVYIAIAGFRYMRAGLR
ncbi:MAG: major capsid protein [Minisyncoccota bacterium]